MQPNMSIVPPTLQLNSYDSFLSAKPLQSCFNSISKCFIAGHLLTKQNVPKCNSNIVARPTAPGATDNPASTKDITLRGDGSYVKDITKAKAIKDLRALQV